jgi:hypothetical protein
VTEIPVLLELPEVGRIDEKAVRGCGELDDSPYIASLALA